MTVRVELIKMDFSHIMPQSISEIERRIYFRKDDEPDYGQPSIGDESYIEESNWKFLPATVLVEIYNCLDDGDRFNMALTCKAWTELFNYPSLWRHREFKFGGLRATRSDTWRALKFVKRFGNYLQYLMITCDHPTQAVAKGFQKAMNDITGTLAWKKCQLKELYIPRLHLDRFWRVGPIAERFTNCLSRFLRKQHKLHVFDMSNSGLTVNNGIKILQALSAGCHFNRRMEELNIEDFFIPRQSIFRERRFLQALACFRRLHTLSLNYNYISDDVLQLLTKTCGSSLRFINIKIYKQDPNFHRIQSQSWKQLKRLTPMLQLNVYFEGIGDYTTITRVLLPDMPVSALQIWTGLHHPDEDWQLVRSLKYIADCYSKTLEEMSLGLETGRETIDEGLLYMLEKLKKLEDLDLHSSIGDPDTVQQICIMQLENKIGLVKCHINLESLTGIEIEAIEEISDTFEEVLNDRGCDFHIEFNEMMLF